MIDFRPHQAARQRRAQIVEFVRNAPDKHRAVGEAAQRWDVTYATVRNACLAAGIDVRMVRGRRPKAFEILARLLNTLDPAAKIARDFGVQVGWVYRIAHEAADAGIRVREDGAEALDGPTGVRSAAP